MPHLLMSTGLAFSSSAATNGQTLDLSSPNQIFLSESASPRGHVTGLVRTVTRWLMPSSCRARAAVSDGRAGRVPLPGYPSDAAMAVLPPPTPLHRCDQPGWVAHVLVTLITNDPRILLHGSFLPMLVSVGS